MSVARHLIRSESSSAEHFGAINATYVYRFVYADPTATPSPDGIVDDIIDPSTGFQGVKAVPGRPLVVDTTTSNLSVRTVSAGLNDAGGVDVTIGCTTYDWTANADPAVRVLTTPFTQSLPAWRVGPLLPTMSSVADEFDDAEWGSAANGLNLEAGTEPTETTPDDGTYRAAGDIGGTPVDWSGNPTQISLPLLRMEIDVMRRGGFNTAVGLATPDALKPKQLLDYVGKRNNAAFAGFAVGTLLLEGVNRSRLDGEWTLCTFSFLWHPWRHAQQVPRPTYGSKAGTLKYEGDPRKIQHMRGVYWKQPYEFGANFNDAVMFTSAELADINGFVS